MNSDFEAPVAQVPGASLVQSGWFDDPMPLLVVVVASFSMVHFMDSRVIRPRTRQRERQDASI